MSRTTTALLLWGAVLAAAAGGCTGTETGNPLSKTVIAPQSGGTVELEGVRVSLDPGDLPGTLPVEVTLTRLSATVPTGYQGHSAIYSLGASVALRAPAQICFPLGKAPTTAAVLWSASASERFEALDTSVERGQGCAQVDAFGRGFLGSQAAANPSRWSAEVGVCPAGSVALSGDATICVAQLKSIATGGERTCALRRDDTALCWGSNSQGRLDALLADPAATFAELALGTGFSCGLRTDGGLTCSGVDSAGQVSGPNAASGPFVAVGAGQSSTCAIRSGGGIVCWGDDSHGQVGGPNADEGGDFTSVSVGEQHTCAVRSDGRARCWGQDDTRSVEGPNTAGKGDFVQIAAQRGGTCALRRSGVISCWGDRAQSLIGGADRGGDFQQIAFGRNHLCAVGRSGALSCWGSGLAARAVSGPNERVGAQFERVTVSDSSTCALRRDGMLRCWGNEVFADVAEPAAELGLVQIATGFANVCRLNGAGAVHCAGVATPGIRVASQALHSDPAPFRQIASSTHVTCGLRVDGSISCGSNGRTADAVPTGEFVQVSAGWAHACALRSDGAIRCWGNAPDGAVSGPNGADGASFLQVAAGLDRTCGLRLDHSVQCWGTETDGEISGPTGSDRRDVVQVAVGGHTSCAVHADGALACWGGDVAAAATAAGTDPAAEFIQVAVGGAPHSVCALRSGGNVSCWDEHGERQIVPGPLLGAEFVQITAGELSTCGLRANGSYRCWGRFFVDSAARVVAYEPG